MDSLKIQDAFEPYYAGRNRIAGQKERRPTARTETSQAPKPAAGASPADTRLSGETDSTTEH